MKVLDAHPLDDTEFAHVDAWWRAANYLSVGQIYLADRLATSASPSIRRPTG